MISSILLIPLFPLAAALWCALPRSDRTAPFVTFFASVVTVGLSLAVLASLRTATEIVVVRSWVALDPLAALLLGLIALVYATAALFSWGYLRSGEEPARRVRIYHANFNLFAFSMVCIPLLSEIGLVWIFVELTTLLSVLLVSYALTAEALEAAWKYMVLTLLGATVGVLGVLLLFWALHAAGSTDFTWGGLRSAARLMPAPLLGAAFALILVGYGAKVGFVPLHTWLPDAHSQAPSPVCAMLSGIETSAVLYVILRLRNVFAADSHLHVGTWFVTVGLVSVIVAAFLILQTHDYKRLFAFSTVEHMGIVMTCAGLFTPVADVALLWQLVAHTVSKSFCFYAAGATSLAAGTREIAEVRGLLGKSPVAAAAMLLGGLAIGGAPPFAVFLSELAILRAGILAHTYVVVALLAIFIVVAFFGLLRHLTHMVAGQPADRSARLPAPCLWALGLGVIPVVLLGVWIPRGLGDALQSAARVLGA